MVAVVVCEQGRADRIGGLGVGVVDRLGLDLRDAPAVVGHVDDVVFQPWRGVAEALAAYLVRAELNLLDLQPAGTIDDAPHALAACPVHVAGRPPAAELHAPQLVERVPVQFGKMRQPRHVAEVVVAVRRGIRTVGWITGGACRRQPVGQVARIILVCVSVMPRPTRARAGLCLVAVAHRRDVA